MYRLLLFSLLSINIAVQAQTPNYIPTNGLVAWFPFNGNALDESTNGNDGIVNGASLSADRNGLSNSAYSFDGTDDYIRLGLLDGITPTSSHTFSFWTNKTNDGCSTEIIIGTFDTPPVDNQHLHYGFRQCDVDCETSMCMGMDIYANWMDSSNELDTSWTCWALVYDSISMQRTIYLDGNQIAQQGGAVPYEGTLDVMLGATKWTNFPVGSHYNGKLDDVAIWNRVLTPLEIEGICNSGVTVGIDDSIQNEVQLYPNPSTGLVTFQLPQRALIDIFDSTGRLILTRIIENTESLDLSHLSGFYTVRISTSNFSLTKSIVLN